MTAVFRYQNSVFSIDQRGPLRQYLDHTLRKEHFQVAEISLPCAFRRDRNKGEK